MKLVIAEKPSVAKQYASVIGANKSCDGYYIGNDYIVTWCVGHLVELMQPGAYDNKYNKWSVQDLPIIPSNWKYGIKKETKKQYDIVKELVNESSVDTIIVACDAGREGEAIARNLIEKIGTKKTIKRLWISSLEDAAIKDGFNKLHDGDEYLNLYKAAQARERADWLCGMNLSRLFTLIYGAGTKLSVGRVMTPTLAMIVSRNNAVKGFHKEKFYTVHLKNCDYDFVTDKISDKKEAEAIKNKLNNKMVIVTDVVTTPKTINPPLLYDLSSLQQDCNRIFGFTANKTLDIAQELYEKKLTTYPRTDSKYLTEDMLDTLNKAYINAALNISYTGQPVNLHRLLNNKKVSDHHAIIITGNTEYDSLSNDSRLVYDLICLRIVCALSNKYIYNSVDAQGLCENVKVSMNGINVVDIGYKEIVQDFMCKNKADKEEKEENIMPKIKKGDRFTAITSVVEGETKPPQQYTEATLLSAMEKAGNKEMDSEVERKGIGTSATRAGIIEKLINDGYIIRDKKKLIPTESGQYLISVVPDKVKSVSLTCEWENQLLNVSKGNLSYYDFMDDISNYIISVVSEFSTVEPIKRKNPCILMCPVCNSDVCSGKYGLYCTSKCGVRFSFYNKSLTPEQAVELITNHKEIELKGLISQKGTEYNILVKYDGYEEFEYTDKDGNNRKGFNLKYATRFPKSNAGKAFKNINKKG